MKIIMEIRENLLCVGMMKELIAKKLAQTTCWCSKTGLPLYAKHIISNCKKVAREICARHDTVVNIILNNILIQRGLTTREKREDRKTVWTAHDEITVGTEHVRSEEWKTKDELLVRG